ncbi:MAG TPA: AAA family ATPase, partial [Acidobacteriota bacterium]|nr:AAA family ATPase [Acidobacteriota bacterium]
MIWLDRIEILGFKSFCEKTLIKIPDGITGIVGPNGCGKSNIVDALNWVLGEQSAKTLRSDKMEEVIFNGSKNRKPLGMAQVSLIWKTERDNPNSPEVVVTRRLFRSGESQYEMNGEICRLKDIHAFFVNEGFDPLAYSILEQGKVDYLFNAKPLDRRTLIEEVAGVAEFKHKKRSAEMKLAENQLQLERVADILSEVEKQLSSLKRQAAKARRFQLLKEERATVQKISFHRRFAQMGIDYDAAVAKLQQCRGVEQTALEQLQHKELQADEMKLRLSELEASLYSERSTHHQTEIEIRDSQGLLQSRRQTIDELKRVIAERQMEIERLTGEEATANQDWQVRTTEANELKVQTDDWIGQHTQLFAQMEAGAADLVQFQQQFEQIRKDILDVLTATTQLKTEHTRLRTQHDHLEEDIREKNEELASTHGQMDHFTLSVQAKTTALQQVTEEIGYLDQTHTEIMSECEKLKLEWDQLQSQLQVVSKQR